MEIEKRQAADGSVYEVAREGKRCGTKRQRETGMDVDPSFVFFKFCSTLKACEPTFVWVNRSKQIRIDVADKINRDKVWVREIAPAESVVGVN